MNQEIGVQEQYVYETASPWRNRGQSVTPEETVSAAASGNIITGRWWTVVWPLGADLGAGWAGVTHL